MEVKDVASTDTMVGAEGGNVCVMVGKYVMGDLPKMWSPMGSEIK